MPDRNFVLPVASTLGAMLSPRRILTCLLVLLAGAVPTVAMADSAGDSQYTDPFGNSGSGTKKSTKKSTPTPTGSSNNNSSGGSGSSGSGSTSGGSSSGTTPSSSGVAGASGSGTNATGTTTTGTTTTGSGTLPHTGDEPLWPAVAGGLLLITGIGLRVHIRATRAD